MNQTITEFLKEEVYPKIDGVADGFFDHLKPSRLLTAGNYALVCPECGEREGFYYPGRAYIQCNRLKQCGKPTSIWGALAKDGLKPYEIVKQLCERAGVSPPTRKSEQRGESSTANEAGALGTPAAPPLVPAGKAIFQVTQALAKKHPEILKKFQAERKYSDSDMATMKLGVYTTPEVVLDALLALGVTRETAISKGYIEVDAENPNKLLKGTSNRVVGYWPHQDKDLRLWGRLSTGKGDKFNPKYRFAPSLSKDIPYLFQQRKPTVLCAVEGTLDAWSLFLMGYWAASLGGAHVNSAQATYLAGQGVTEICLIIDGDKAGYEGAVVSIRNCESVGIVAAVVALGEGLDDPDAMRQAGRTDEMHKLIEGRINSGEYLARLAGSYANQDIPYLRGLRRVESSAEALTPVSRGRWIDFSASLALPTYSDRSAVRLLANLMEGGMDFRDASIRVRDLTGFTFSMEEHVDG